MNQTTKEILAFAGVLVLLYIFLVSIGLMGAAFKLFGKSFAVRVFEMTSSPYNGLFIGILVTSLVQSSSTTTSMVVGMVAGGALTVTTAIPIVMGANIGTSVTNTIVSLGHVGRKEELSRAFAASTVHDFFNLLAVLIIFPLQLTTNFLGKFAHGLGVIFKESGGLTFSSPIKMVTKPTIHWIVDLADKNAIIVLVVGILFLFIALRFIVKLLRSIIIKRVETLFDNYIFKNAFRAFGFGIFLTVLVQSSSITTSIIIPLAGAGVLTLIQIYPYTLGANIGTTITAILASLVTGEIAPVTVAFSHLLFNVMGIIIITGIPFLRLIPVRLARWMAAKAAKNRLTPFLYILVVFFLIPIFLIFVMR
ncbi:MAG: Na/Pi symporter [Fidelibacterota bacterium]